MEPRRRVVAGLTGLAFLLVGIGVAAIIFDSGFFGGGGARTGSTGTSSPRPSSSLAIASSASPSASLGPGAQGTPGPSDSAAPSASASPIAEKPIFIAEGDALVYYAPDGLRVPVKAVPGLEVRVEKNRAIYYALSSNCFGLVAGSYAGEFMPLVTMGMTDGSSAQTGGIVLASQVVTRMIADRLALIETPADRWIVALPVDIRASSAPVDVSFDQFGLAGWSNTPRVVVRFAGSLKVVEANPTNGGFHVLVEQLGVTAWQVIDPIRLGLPSDAIDPAHVMNQLLVYGSGKPSLGRDYFFDGQAPVGQQMLSATADVSVSLVVNGSRADLGPDKVLSVDDVPIFVASS